MYLQRLLAVPKREHENVLFKMSIVKITELYTVLQYLKKINSQANVSKQVTPILFKTLVLVEQWKPTQVHSINFLKTIEVF